MLIEIKDLYKIYNEGKESEVRALDGVTLHIDRGEFVAIVGQSGSGKSTLMNVLGCLDIPTYGEYHLNGTDVTSLSDKQLATEKLRADFYEEMVNFGKEVYGIDLKKAGTK